MRRRDFLGALAALAPPNASSDPGFRLRDVTRAAGIDFVHNSGAFGKKYLPETMGPGCAFLDYDNDGWQDILLVNSMDWPGHRRRRSTLKLYRNNRNGTFTDVTRAAGLDVEMYGLGVAVGDYNNDGFVDLFITCLGQSRLFQNTGRGTFVDVTVKAGLGGHDGFSTSALWFDYDRDGHLDLFVTNYVKWSERTDVFCSFDGKQKSYCTPEAYRGATCWLFRNRGDGTFEDVTAKAGLLDTSSKSLGVASLSYDNDGWPDLFVANDTQPNKLYRNQRNGTFSEVGVRAGLAFSEDGRARAGMGVDVADLDDSGLASIVVTNFDNEMLGLYRATKSGAFIDQAPKTNMGLATRRSLGFGCFFFDANLDGHLDLLVVNGHIDETISRARHDVTYAQSPHLFLNDGSGSFHDVANLLGAEFSKPKVARGAAFGDIHNDGAQDVLITTNNGPAYLFKNEQSGGNRWVRVKLIGTKSNRDAIGAVVKYEAADLRGSRTVKSGSSYLSQSETVLTFGLGPREKVDKLQVLWPSGRTEEYHALKAAQRYFITESKGIRPL
ncbi:CRTAC1 family protein [uncultured Paludibaculum sp.]|uniref:CRTAC1 family protein n=1 Tax=uncultured Paludibaculum sp. TaxID=1765020 RepID=UPI002AAB625D|nr:CRTAC1 family protein [uncultured Paludibaculum sp.]